MKGLCGPKRGEARSCVDGGNRRLGLESRLQAVSAKDRLKAGLQTKF
jgi:hypothetical protein